MPPKLSPTIFIWAAFGRTDESQKTGLTAIKKSGLAGNWDVKTHRWTWHPKSNDAGLGNLPALNCAFLGRPCWPALVGVLRLAISIWAPAGRVQNSPERWSLSYRQMLDAAVDLIQWDIRDTPCPFGGPRWHISGSACTLAVFNPALFIPKRPLTDAACPQGPSICDSPPDTVYSY